ncbi:MAG TPA: HIT family protein [Candidatus Saccharimonadales bacterium]|nr:HIT family protein [Candidatus Saccharimonadales bacterium]
MTNCSFCEEIQAKIPEIYFEDETNQFVGMWEINPVRPGHTLLIPKRHVRLLSDLNERELQSIAKAVVTLKQYIADTDLRSICDMMLKKPVGPKSTEFIAQAIDLLKKMDNRPPDAFNDGLNDGEAAGQTKDHLHWHIIPRWSGDVQDPRGGVRNMFPGLGNYHKGVQK